MNASRPLRQVIGEAVRQLREAEGSRQEDLARAARSCGLAWPRSKIAALERGDKSVSLEEFLLLAPVLQLALHREVTYAHLFPDGAGLVDLSSKARAEVEDLAAVFGAHVPDVELAVSLPRATDAWDEQAARLHKLGLKMTAQELAAADEQTGLAEERAARKLGESKLIVSAVAVNLWNRSLSAERDARVAEVLAPDAPPATVQAKRGRITRELLDEMRTFIAAADERRST